MVNQKDIQSKLVQNERPEEIPEGPIDPLWSILPSYYMYSNTINKGINDMPVPPNYELRPSLCSINTTQSTVSGSSGVTSLPAGSSSTSVSQGSGNPLLSTDPQIEVENQGSYIKENLLDNIHKLKSFSSGGNERADEIEISIVFTEDVCMRNRPPKIIDPSLVEYSQGEYTHGYVLIKNNGEVPIPFDMFYFVLEGEYEIYSNPRTVTPSVEKKTFLQMLDFSASYNQAIMNRLIHFDPLDSKKIDYEDSTYDYDLLDEKYQCYFSTHQIQPKIHYKRSFSFKIPHKLLDWTCPEGALPSHVNLPPSFGGETRDFATIHTAVNYGVHARFIGRHSMYNPKIPNDKDEFVVLKGCSESFRVVPFSTPTSDFKQMKSAFDLFYKTVNERIDEGSKFVDKVTQQISADARIQKLINSPRAEVDTPYEFYFPVYKQSAFFKATPSNTVKVKTPKVTHTIEYIPPKKICIDPPNTSSWNIEIPFEISINSGGSNKPVDIKSIEAELVVVTLESLSSLIPIEMHHDLIYNQVKQKNTIDGQDEVLTNLILPARKLNDKIHELIAKASNDPAWVIEKSIVSGLKALAEMNTKIMNLPIVNSKISQGGSFHNIEEVPWVKQADGKAISKSFDMHLDLTSAVNKGAKPDFNRAPAYDRFTLVPNFQSCNLCRMYYIRVIVGLSNGQNVQVKLPVTVEKSFLTKV